MIIKILSKILATIMLLLIPISIVGMFFKFELFLTVLVSDLMLIGLLLVFTNTVKTSKLQKLGWFLMATFYVGALIAHCVFTDFFANLFTIFCLVFECIGYALVIAGGEVKEDDKD